MKTQIGSACFALALAGCIGYATVDGYDAEYVEGPPPDIAYYPRYQFHDGYVYAVHGRYYHQHQGRWTVYRHAPPEIREQERGRAEHQRR